MCLPEVWSSSACSYSAPKLRVTQVGVKDSDVQTEGLETQEQTQGSDNRAPDLAVSTRRNQGF